MKAINSSQWKRHLVLLIVGYSVMSQLVAAENKIRLGNSSIHIAQPGGWARYEFSRPEGPAMGFGREFAPNSSNPADLQFRNEKYAAANLKLYLHEGRTMPSADEIMTQTGAKGYKALKISGTKALEFRYESISVGDSITKDEHFTGVMSRNFMISRYLDAEGGYLVCELTAFPEVWKSQPSLPDVFNDFCSSITFNN